MALSLPSLGRLPPSLEGCILKSGVVIPVHAMGSGASRHRPLPCLIPLAAAEIGPDGDRRPLEHGPLDVGSSFRYVPSSVSSDCGGSGEIGFKIISGASVSANTSTPLPLYDAAGRPPPSGFRSSSSFSILPIQISAAGCGGSSSGPLDSRFFLSGPIENRALSGPLALPGPFSGLLEKKKHRSVSGRYPNPLLLRRSFSEKNRPCVFPLRSFLPRQLDLKEDPAFASGQVNVQWAQGKAGEDCVHVVVSGYQRWLFVGIYDGFNGSEAAEFLVGNLFLEVFDELQGLFWEEAAAEGAAEDGDIEEAAEKIFTFQEGSKVSRRLRKFLADGNANGELDFSTGSGGFAFTPSKTGNGMGSRRREAWKMRFSKWPYDSEERAKETKQATARSRRWRMKDPIEDHGQVLAALARAMEATEVKYLEMTDKVMNSKPELSLTGSCLLVVLMRDEHVYVMNVGDSRAIVAQSQWNIEESNNGSNGENTEVEVLNKKIVKLDALQLSSDHSTSIQEEVLRIRREHPEDNRCIINDRVKGRLKVTRAFGAGYLKQPKWNSGLLEIFRCDYVGTAPYIYCTPSLSHHKLGASDRFLVLSSDGLYQYLSNEEVVLHVESFMERFPDGDPAQSLLEELLSRAANKAGLEFYELLDIPQGDRRKYHDDVTIMVISLEGRIWKSSGECVAC